MAQRKIERGGTYVINGEKVEIKGHYDCMKTRKYTTTSEAYISIPSDYVEGIVLRALVASEWRNLNRETLESTFDVHPNETSDTGEPESYVIMTPTSEILIRPTPDTSYEYDFIYYKSLAALSDDSDTNWWTDSAWELLVYGALLEAQPFLFSDNRLGVWMDMFARELYNLEKKGENKRVDGGRNYVRPFYSI
jgi:hypothetical protein